MTAIHESLKAMWVDKEIPEHHKWRWLLPIPKVASPELTDLRLVEVSRKLWSSVLLRMVSKEWARTGCLNKRQQGFVTGKSMNEAVLEVMNTMESAKEMQCDLYMSSWGIKRAFDRVPKQLLIFASIRLGVPHDVAEYLVNTERGGITVVKHHTHRTPTGGRVVTIALRPCASWHNSERVRTLLTLHSTGMQCLTFAWTPWLRSLLTTAFMTLIAFNTLQLTLLPRMTFSLRAAPCKHYNTRPT